MRHVTAQQLSAFLDGALTGVSRDLVTRHLAACADCRERHALWHIYDEVLQRVLSWEPNDRTMEEASTRVELTLTAERRGLPPPDFTSVLHPVIASTPGPTAPPRNSSLFPTLPPIQAPRPAAPPAPAARVTPAPPATMPPAPPAAPPPPQLEYAPPPAPVAGPPPSMPPDPDRYLPPPPSAWAPPQAPSPPAYMPPAPAPQFVPQPARGYAPPIAPYEDFRPRPEPHDIPWASVPRPQRGHRMRAVLIACGVLAALLLLAMPFMPDVIRIHAPDGSHVTRVEFMQGGQGAQPAVDPAQRLAERTSSAPPPEPYRALPAAAESVTAKPAAVDTPVTASVPPPPPAQVKPPEAAKPKPHAATKPHTAPHREPQATEPETTTGAENSITFVPVQVKTEVHLSSTQPKPAAAAAPAADSAADASMPLLCGEVLDESGAPIEGARVRLTAPPLTVRTDKRGRFCVACPAGERTFLVDAPGFVAVTRGVELTDGTFETHITLAAEH